ncbi:MAG: hypothetical protein IJ638_00925, partial [Alphaproteobacteria bacterium]|nr:hypothetical protein [Alphaproteobacteria bacterium]
MEISTVLLILFILVSIIASLNWYLVFCEKNKIKDAFLKLKFEKEKLEFVLKTEKESATNNLLMMQKTLEEKFENISNKVLKNQKMDLDREQKENLSVILNPFKTDINNFKTLIERTNEINREDKG